MERADPADHRLQLSSVLSSSHWLPHLQVHRHFVKAVSRLGREAPLNRKLVSHVPKRPTEGGRTNPQHPTVLAPEPYDDAIEIGETGGIPRAGEQFPNCTPEESSKDAPK